MKSLLNFLKRRRPALKEHDEFDRKIQSSIGNEVDLAYLRNHFESPLPPAAEDVLLAKNKAILESTYNLLGLSRQEFETNYLSVVLKLARYVQLLPASERHHHNGVGGLFRHSLEVSNAAIRRSTGKAFCGDLQGEIRSKTRVRWPVAVGIAALLHDIGKAVHDMVVVSATRESRWAPFEEDLLAFAVRERGYLVSWRSGRTHREHEIVGMAIVDQLISTTVRAWLTEGDKAILPAMLQAIGGFENPEYPIINQIVKEADQESTRLYQSRPEQRITDDEHAITDVECAQGAGVVGVGEPNIKSDDSRPLGVASPASDQLHRIAPEMFAAKKWVVNVKDRDRGIFWIDRSGEAWASWPALFNSAKLAFEEYGFNAYPKSPGGFFDMLALAGMLEKVDGEFSVGCQIKIESKKPFGLKLAKVKSNELIDLLVRYSSCEVEIVVESLGLELGESKMVAPNEDKKVEQASEDQLPNEVLNKETKEPETSSPIVMGVETSDAQSSLKETVPLESRMPKVSEAGKSGFSEYFRGLDNNDIVWLRGNEGSDSDDSPDRDALSDIACAVITGRIPDDQWGVIDGCLYIVWPKSASYLADDPERIVGYLHESRHLVARGECKDVDVKASGISRVRVGNKTITALVLNGAVSKRLARAYQLPTVSATESTKKIKSLDAGDRGKKRTEPVGEGSAVKGGVKEVNLIAEMAKEVEKVIPPEDVISKGEDASFSEGGIAVAENGQVDSGIMSIMASIDTYLSSSELDGKINRIKIKADSVEIHGFVEIFFHEICTTFPSIKRQFYSRIIDPSAGLAEKLPGGVVVISRDVLPKTYERLNNNG